MAVDRLLPTSATPGVVDGDDYMDAVSEELGALWDRSRCRLSAIGGTANAITATLDPALTAGLVDGMRFTFVVGSTNTGAATLAINGGAAKSIVDKDGTALQAGDLPAGRLVEVEYHAASDKHRLLGGVTADGSYHYYNAFTASGTWTKPNGVSADAWVIVQCWGAGGGGGTGTRAGGGGGGFFAEKRFRLGDLSSTETVTIGAAGATNGQGGNTTFGSKLTGYGGGGGNSTTLGGGGGGGGPSAKGANASTTAGGAAGGIMGGAGGAADAAGAAGVGGGGGGGGGTASSAAPGQNGGDSWFGGGGGGGGGGSSAAGGTGGSSVWGGGGGAGLGSSAGSAGTSIHGGNGGSNGNTGSAPGGGGGRNAAGARGECRVWIIA